MAEAWPVKKAQAISKYTGCWFEGQIELEWNLAKDSTNGVERFAA